jgi:2-oxo-4-hydroxy-4-carboxy-5-ureidoimidazoline decarboxylase
VDCVDAYRPEDGGGRTAHDKGLPVNVEELNRMSVEEASAALERCCGARSWIEAMCAARPFGGPAELLEASETLARGLGRADWLEAFSHHPRIGDVESLRRRFGSTAAWASAEQRGAAGAPEATLGAMAEGNRAYEEKFGYIFIVCATGRSADDMLASLRQRLSNPPERELGNAIEEQMKITRLRLEKLLDGVS